MKQHLLLILTGLQLASLAPLYAADTRQPNILFILAADAISWGDNICIEQALLNGSTLEGLPSGQPLDQGHDEITLAEALLGYHSAFIGKWHLAGHGSRGWQPQDQGFEALAYSDEGGSPYFNGRKSSVSTHSLAPQPTAPTSS